MLLQVLVSRVLRALGSYAADRSGAWTGVAQAGIETNVCQCDCKAVHGARSAGRKQSKEVAGAKRHQLVPSRADGGGTRSRWLQAVGFALLDAEPAASDYAAGVVAH